MTEHDRTSPIVLVLGADEHFAMPLAVTLYSTLYHLSPDRDIDIHVMDAGLKEASRVRLEDLVQRTHDRAVLHWIYPDLTKFEEVSVELKSRYNVEFKSRYNRSLFTRFLIPEVLPDVGRALYIDSDVLVEANIEELWAEPLNGTPLAAVRERTVSCPVAGIGEWENLGLDPDEAYFNAGVLLMDLDQWRREGIHTDAIEYLADPNHRIISAGNQEPLNAVLCGRWKHLDPRWNALWWFSPKEVLEEACLSHFAGSHPWWPNCRHPAQTEFFRYLWASGWHTSTAFFALLAKLRFQRAYDALKRVTRPSRHALGMKSNC
jgi:lipopolysaccharide biosynthesis glycosyltransferase